MIYASLEAAPLPRFFPADDTVHSVAVYHQRELHVVKQAVVIRAAAAFEEVEVLRHRLVYHDVRLLAHASQSKTKRRA